MEKNKNVRVEIKTNNGLRVIGTRTQTLNFANPDEKMTYFNLEVGQSTGIGKVTITRFLEVKSFL
jgi:uncharacterized protein YfaS (alpha-2-macroglobulin family)